MNLCKTTAQTRFDAGKWQMENVADRSVKPNFWQDQMAWHRIPVWAMTLSAPVRNGTLIAKPFTRNDLERRQFIRSPSIVINKFYIAFAARERERYGMCVNQRFKIEQNRSESGNSIWLMANWPLSSSTPLDCCTAVSRGLLGVPFTCYNLFNWPINCAPNERTLFEAMKRIR